jgi:hypothetical protein
MTGQGHPDQWLGYLSQCGLQLDERLNRIGVSPHVVKRIRRCPAKPAQLFIQPCGAAIDGLGHGGTLFIR